MTPPTANDGVRRRSLSGASALIARRFTRQSAPRSTISRSESSTTRRRATIAAVENHKVHVRIVPNIENPSRSLIFDIVDRDLKVGSIIRIGRYSERHANTNCMSFKSKVVSRCHCEVYVETDGKLYIRDTKSSSGTFLNHVRLSPAGNESRPVEITDGDMVQIGVDFQGGREEMYRSVKMRFEVNRSTRPRPLSYNLNAFQNLRQLTQQQPPRISNTTAIAEEENRQIAAVLVTEPAEIITPPPIEEKELICTTTTHHSDSTNSNHTTIQTNNIITAPLENNNEIDECCICLYALAPFQALFVSPCSHTYHFKCIRPLLNSYPGFQCPICRTYSDLEASVAIEADEVLEKYITNRKTVTAEQEQEEMIVTIVDSGLGLVNSEAEMIPSEPPTTPQQDHMVSAQDSSSIEDNGILSNTEEEDNADDDEGEHPNSLQRARTTPVSTMVRPPRERRTSHIMDKIKMVFFEKKKTSTKNNRVRQRPLSYPNHLLSEEEASGSRQIVTRQVTQHDTTINDTL